jgi:hypothetical protein
MKKLFSSKSFLTMMSILSILLGFSLLCGGALAALHYMGVVSLFSAEEEIMISDGLENNNPDFKDYTKTPHMAVGVGTEGLVPEDLIVEMPFTDTYYLKLEVYSETKEGAFAEGVYEIWRYENQYRIHRYHLSDSEVEYITICDGNRVMMTDFTTASLSYAEYGVTYAFSEVAPLPNFRKLFADVHSFFSYEEGAEYCSFSCEYPLLGVTDHVEFSKSTGLISHYSRHHEDTVLLSVDVIAVSDSYDFMDYIFSFD